MPPNLQNAITQSASVRHRLLNGLGLSSVWASFQIYFNIICTANVTLFAKIVESPLWRLSNVINPYYHKTKRTVPPRQARRLLDMASTTPITQALPPISASSSQQYRKPRMQAFFTKLFPIGFKREFVEVLVLAWPAILTSFFQSFLQTVSIIMCGHLSKEELDAAGLANSIINVFGISIGFGMSTACDTFFSQTFGSENKKRVGIYLQRGLIIMNSTALLICCVHINIEPVLLLMGQNPEIASLAASYMLCFVPAVFFDFNFLTLARYLQNQNIVYPSMICGFIGNVFNIISQYVCIYVLKFSYLSSAICQASSLGLMMILELAYILISKAYVVTWDGWNLKEALRGWGMFIRLALAGIFMVGLEEWSFEIATFVAGTIDSVQLGIQSILFQLEAMSYMVPLGVSIAINIRVGQHLGANRAEHAKTAYRVGVAMIIMTSTIMAILLISLRDYIPYIFTDEKVIVDGVSDVLVLNAGFQYSDGISATAAGALRGCGRQLTGAIILFVGYYVISLPIGMSLALLTPLKVYGFWIGLLVGISLEAILFITVVGLTNWKNQCERAAIVAYGQSDANGHQRQNYEPVSDFVSETDPDFDRGEEDPLLGQGRGKRRRRRSTGYSSRRASLSAVELKFDESAHLSEQDFKKILCKRFVFLVILVVLVVVAIFFRVFQSQNCFVLTNSTEYAGILPLCNNTLSNF